MHLSIKHQDSGPFTIKRTIGQNAQENFQNKKKLITPAKRVIISNVHSTKLLKLLLKT